jgi:hypothetical protein
MTAANNIAPEVAMPRVTSRKTVTQRMRTRDLTGGSFSHAKDCTEC